MDNELIDPDPALTLEQLQARIGEPITVDHVVSMLALLRNKPRFPDVIKLEDRLLDLYTELSARGVS